MRWWRGRWPCACPCPGGLLVWLLSGLPRAGHIQGLPGVKQTVPRFCFVGRKMHLPRAVGSLRSQPTHLLPGSAGRRPAAQSMDLMSFAKEVDGAGRRCCLRAGSRVAGSTSGVQFRGRRVLSIGPVSVAVCVCVCVCMSGFSRILGVVSQGGSTLQHQGQRLALSIRTAAATPPKLLGGRRATGCPQHTVPMLTTHMYFNVAL